MATYLLRVKTRFEAAHHLLSYGGTPEPSHGHSWQVEATVSTQELNEEGLGFDFVQLRRTLEELAAGFHHRDINTVAPFDRRSPTTEHLARWFYDGLVERLPGIGLVEVTLWEGPDCSATYRP